MPSTTPPTTPFTMPPELRLWLQQQLQSGYSRASVQDALLKAGWQSGVVASALDTVWPSQQADTPTPTSPTASSPRLPDPDLSLSPRQIDAGDRWVDVIATLSRPRVVVLGGVLSADECDALVAAARPRLARSLTVHTQTGGEELNPDRTSQGMFFRRGETELVARIEARIARLLNWPVDHGEGMQVLHYGPGAQYKPHYDYFDPAQPGSASLLRRGGQRVATLVMYLNEPAQGGGTTFPDAGLEVAPVRGNAVFFSYDRPHPATGTLHGGAPVVQGDKWVATKWLRERVFE
jgi:prolyl 4-hydroxylase